MACSKTATSVGSSINVSSSTYIASGGSDMILTMHEVPCSGCNLRSSEARGLRREGGDSKSEWSSLCC